MNEIIEANEDIFLEDNRTFPQESKAAELAVENGCDLIFINIFADDFTGDFETAPVMTARDCELMFDTVIKMYEEEKVVLNNAAERFLQRSREIQSSAEFAGLMDQAFFIEAKMHIMCGHDDQLRKAMEKHDHKPGEEHDEDEDSDSYEWVLKDGKWVKVKKKLKTNA